jgi:chromosomal replication initiation ATPase DnaA
LTVDWALAQFAGQENLAVQRFKAFVDEGSGEGHRKDFHRGSFEGRALGDDTFIDQALRRAEEKSRAAITLGQVIKSVCSTYQLSADELSAPGKAQPAAEARAVAAFLVRNADSLSLNELAGFLNRDLSGLSQAALRLERRSGMDDQLRSTLMRVAEKIGISVC